MVLCFGVVTGFSSLDQLEQTAFPFFSPFGGSDHQIIKNYLRKILLSGPGPGPGTWATYEKAHRARLTAIFVPKLPSLPADAISHIVGLWAHTGYY